MSQTTTDRRRFLASVGGLGALAGLAAYPGLAREAHRSEAAGGEPAPAVPLDVISRVPWPYQPLDPDATAQAAFQAYLKGLCMRGVFEGVVGQVASRLGPPYTVLPFAMFGYGAGGVGGWGTLCGTLNGAAAALALLSANPAPLIAALFAWYEAEALPDHVPAGARFPNTPVAAGSVLCHASVAAWRRAAKKPFSSPERFERCGLLAASVARKTVLLLNAAPPSPPPLDAASAGCLGCHGRGGTPTATGRMRCEPCHTPAALRAQGHPPNWESPRS